MEAVRKMNTSENIININLKEYFWSLLEQWKCILIAGLVFAMLVPAALAFKNYKEDLDAKNDRDSLSAMSYEDLLNTLNEGDREEVMSILHQADTSYLDVQSLSLEDIFITEMVLDI